MKKKYLIVIAILVIVALIVVIALSSNKSGYSYEWIDEKESIIKQAKLYVKDSSGNHVDGIVTITYLNGKSEDVEISKDGTLYVKTVIKEVKNPRKK